MLIDGEVINTPWPDPCVKIKRLSLTVCLYVSLSFYLHLYIRIFEYSLNDVTVIRLRFYAVFHSPTGCTGVVFIPLFVRA